MPTYTYDHIHLRSREPMETAQYFQRMFGAEIIESLQPDGQPRVDLDINGLAIFIAQADDSTPPGPVDPHLGLDHFGLRVDDLDEAVAELKGRYRTAGSHEIFLSPGVQFVAEHWLIEASLQLPVVREMAAGRAETDYRFVLGLRLRW